MTRTTRIALALAVAAIAPATAQARPLDMTGDDARLIHAQNVPREASAVVGAEDLAFSRRPASAPAVTTANGMDADTGSVAGLAILLAAAGAAVAIHHGRKAKLSPA
jgi:hypothetical protein